MMSNSTLDLKLVIAASLSNASSFIPSIFENIKFISKYFKETKCVFIESDSKDETISTLKKHKGELSVNGFSLGSLIETIPLRTGRISKARNFYLDFIEKNYKDFDLLLVLDFNESNIEPLTEESLLSNFVDMNWDMICANQGHIYYDLWALRHPTWMPFDCWENFYLNKPFFISTQDYKNIVISSRFIHIDKNLPLIKVDSAFGGAAFIKIKSIGNARHNYLSEFGYETCEWPSFCKSLNNGNANIFINPKFINQNKPNRHVVK